MGNNSACGLHGGTEESTRERQTLEKVRKWFEKYEKATDIRCIQIPQTEFEDRYMFIKDTLESTKQKTGFDQTNSDNRIEDMNSQLHSVQILNDRSTTPATLFVKQLQYALQKEHHIGATVIEKLDELKPEERQVLVTICNRNESGSITTAVEKCLKNIDRSFYKRIILIVLHVARQETLPKMPSRGELQRNMIYSEIGRVIDMGFKSGMIYSCRINDNAFKEIANFCSENGSTSNSTVVQSGGTNCSTVKRQINLQDCHIRKDIDDSNSMVVQLLNTSDTILAKSLAKELQDKLGNIGIKTTEITSSNVLDQEKNVLIIICNKIDKDTIQHVVDKSLDKIKEDQYNRIILVMLHCIRKPPCTRQRLQSSDCPEKYKDIGRIVDIVCLLDRDIYMTSINGTAFSEIANFIFEYNSKYTGTQVTSKKSIMERDETCAAKSNTVADKNSHDCLDISKPTAYILNPLESAASTKFVHEFREEMKTHGIVLNVITDCDDIKLDTDVFLILVCQIMSRFENDVDKCLSVISSKQYDKTILVILHLTTYKHQQPRFQRILMRSCPEKYASIFRIIDMSFTYDKGIYPCEMNAYAFLQLEKIYDSHKKTFATKTEVKENEASNDNTESRNNQQLDESHTEVVPEQKIQTDEKDDLTKIVEKDEQPLIDFINFHEFNGIFLYTYFSYGCTYRFCNKTNVKVPCNGRKCLQILGISFSILFGSLRSRILCNVKWPLIQQIITFLPTFIQHSNSLLLI